MSLKEAERELRRAQEKLDKEKKKVSKQRRIKTSSSRIFNDEEMELTVRELARLEREKSEESGAKKRVRRLKQGSCSSSLGDDSLIAGQPLVKGSSNQLSSDEMKKEKAEQTGFIFVNF